MMPGDTRMLIEALERIAGLRANVDTLSQSLLEYQHEMRQAQAAAAEAASAAATAAATRDEAILVQLRRLTSTVARNTEDIGMLKADVGPLKRQAENADAVRRWIGSRWRLGMAIAAGIGAAVGASTGLMALAERVGR